MSNLYVTEQGARIEKEYDRIVVMKNREILADVPVLKISEVVLVGNIGITTPALQMLLKRDKGLVLLDRYGGFLGRLVDDHTSNTGLKRQQYLAAEDPSFCLQAARSFARGKLKNSRVRILRISSSASRPGLKEKAECLKGILNDIEKADSIAGVRALEAWGSRIYFAVIRNHLKKGWVFPARKRRPPPDPVNALLGAVYTLLTEAVYSAVMVAGLDPYCGFYHTERWGRPALVLDLMEEFRPVIADSVVLTLINKGILAQADFVNGPPERPVILQLNGYRKVLKTFGERLRTRVTAPNGQRTTFQHLLELQARSFAAVVEGRKDSYGPFCSR